MSGTSVDGVDAALVELSENSMQLIATASCDYPSTLRTRLLELNSNATSTLADLAELDHLVSLRFIEATTRLLTKSQVDAAQVIAIGSHGQTIFHSPDTHPATTMQIGDNSLIATRTGIDTIGDFRRADLAVGGQGAPLMPAFHSAMLGNKQPRFILNLGGIANITVLGAGPVIGFDTGPANTLLDAWINKTQGKAYDANGNWARASTVNEDLLATLLTDEFFSQTPPKSTGADYFNLPWLEKQLPTNIDANIVQTTLAELTAVTVADSINACTQQILNSKTGKLPSDNNIEVLVCGGGAHNRYLLERLATRLPQHAILTTDVHGLDSDFAEAMGFAWLAYRNIRQLPGNLPSVTGASRPVVLGGRYSGRSQV